MTKRLNFETKEINRVLFTNLDATFVKKMLFKVKSKNYYYYDEEQFKLFTS